MSVILAIETTTAACSVALADGNQVLSRFELEARQHTKLLLPMVDSLLKEAGCSLQEVSAIAFTHGPGSFTGIRIGFSCVQGLAFATGLPVMPVSSLEVLALTVKNKLSDEQQCCLLVPAFDARMAELYCAGFVYRKGDESPIQRVGEDLLCPLTGFKHYLTDLQAQYPQLPIVGVGDGWLCVPDEQSACAITYPDQYPSAEFMLPMAKQLYSDRAYYPIDQVEPLYLREKVTWKKRERLRD